MTRAAPAFGPDDGAHELIKIRMTCLAEPDTPGPSLLDS